MSLSLLSPSRTILMISDDALFIFEAGARGVSLFEAVPWGGDNFEQHVAKIIAKDCGGKPVLILNDMVEQHYRKEKIPRVSVMDKANVLQRRLKVAFPDYPVRAALPLKEKIAKTDKSMASNVYIFAAVSASEPFIKTMDAARRSLVPIAGFCLLPVESSDMVKKLADKLSARDKRGVSARWTVFIGQHQNGGLRQIVTKDGELALTRMTPVVDSDENPEQWMEGVLQEFDATMSYLSRFGFDQTQGLNVILIANPSIGEMMQERIETPCNLYTLTSKEAASLLRVNIGRQEDLHYADVLHAAWCGRKSKFILPMKSREIDRVSKPRQVAVAASALLLLGAAFQGYQLANSYQILSVRQGEIDDFIQRKSQLDLQYQKEVKKKEDLGYDIQLIQSALAVYDDLENKRIKALPLFRNIGMALGRDMRIDKITVEKSKPTVTQRFFSGENKDARPLFEASMQMTFPSTTDAVRGNAEVRGLETRLKTMMPDHRVKVTKLLEDYEYSEEIVVEAGDVENKKISQDYIAEIEIEGPPVQ